MVLGALSHTYIYIEESLDHLYLFYMLLGTIHSPAPQPINRKIMYSNLRPFELVTMLMSIELTHS